MDFYESSNVKLVSCSFCGRNFAVESLQRHETICQKTSRKRPVFDSSKQRNIGTSEKKYLGKNKTLFNKKSNSITNISKQSNWRQKHEEFIRTVRAAREATVAIKEGRKPPSPPPPVINPDYIQCPHCLRRFNETAAERHIPFCAEQSKRLSNKKIATNNISNQAALRASARQKYRAPLPHSNKKKANLPLTVTAQQRMYAQKNQLKEKSEQLRRQKFQQKAPEWDSSFGPNTNVDEVRSKTGLRPSSGYKPTKNNTQFSSKKHQKSSKPPIRKIAGKSSHLFGSSTACLKPNEPLHDNYSFENFNFESDVSTNYTASAYQTSSTNKHQLMNKSKNSSVSNKGFRGNYHPTKELDIKRSSAKDISMYPDGYGYINKNPEKNDFYHWLDQENNTFDEKQNALPSKFCHECGSRYPISKAKFCCECGVKRIMLT